MRSIPRPHQAPPDTHLIALPGATESPTPRSPPLTPPPTTPLTARLSPVPTLCVLQSLMSLFPQFPASNSAKHTRRPYDGTRVAAPHTLLARQAHDTGGASAAHTARAAGTRHWRSIRRTPAARRDNPATPPPAASTQPPLHPPHQPSHPTPLIRFAEFDVAFPSISGIKLCKTHTPPAKRTRHPQNAHVIRKTHSPSAERARCWRDTTRPPVASAPHRAGQPLPRGRAPPARSQITETFLITPTYWGLHNLKVMLY